ncbi:MAG: 4-vinyl reductase [Actinobacteria bacterium]|nr:4-vinyl reductase [Actinomycetota bacterium]MBU1942037.1 4-vinyl reductase [Actinomycetota bacterium]MBU2687192.1 4-vinyl reductase [Actinomycetota bacterium]
MWKVRIVVALMEFCEGHPLLVRCLFKPLANLPWVSDRLHVMIRAYMGATAFQIHDVDASRGRIGIGGVDEIMFGSELLWVLHEVLGRMGPEEKDRALYDVGFITGYYEAKDAIRKGQWAPKPFLPLIEGGRLLESARSDPLMARFLDGVLKTESALIITGGGWGNITDFDYSGPVIRVEHEFAQEAAWLGPSDGPVCRYFAGGMAGHVSAVAGRWYEAREVECAAEGAPRCVFEASPSSESDAELERRESVERLLARRS